MDPSRRLLHRWFVEFNPFYLLSAMLVLGGTIAMARGLGQEGNRYSGLAVEAIVEAYAIALVAGATLLYRLGQRRSAVMLAFLAAAYHGDLMLHAETCPNLGGVGAAAAVGWLALYGAKLVALARGLRLRLNRAAWETVALAGTGLVGLPWLLHAGDERLREPIVTTWLFLLAHGTAGARLASRVPLHAWGETVLRRSARVLVGLGAVLVLLHTAFWTTQSTLRFAPLLALVPLVAIRFADRPRTVLVIVAAVLGFVAHSLPESLGDTAAVAALAVFLRARTSVRRMSAPTAATTGPYRHERIEAVMEWLERDARAAQGLDVLAIACGWLAVWTWSWHGGPLPVHEMVVDVAGSLVLVGLALRWRRILPVLPLTMAWSHRFLTTNRVPLPVSAVGWGAAAVVVGFVLLLGSLGVSYGLRDLRERVPCEPHGLRDRGRRSEA